MACYGYMKEYKDILSISANKHCFNTVEINSCFESSNV